MSYRPIGGRRSRSAAWQWGLIGFIPGLFCGVMVMAIVLLEGTIPAYFLPTPAPQVFETVIHVVMTPTEDPNKPTDNACFPIHCRDRHTGEPGGNCRAAHAGSGGIERNRIRASASHADSH